MKKLFLTLSVGLLVSPLNVVAEDSEVESLKIEIKETEDKLNDLKNKLKELTGDDDNIVLIDSDLVYIEFVEIVEKEDKMEFGWLTFVEENDMYEISFLVENKTNEDLTIEIPILVIDGMIVDQAIITMETEIKAGKTEIAKLSIHNFDDLKFPELTGIMEGELKVFNGFYGDISEIYRFEIDLDNLK